MKKLISILLVFLLIPIAISQDETTTDSDEPEEDPGTLPDSPLYGFKLFREGLGLALTFNSQLKIEKRLLHAQRRLREMEIMLERKKLPYAEKAQQRHEKIMEKLEEIEIEDPEKAAKIQERLEKHQEKLEKIQEKVEKKIELNEQQRERIQNMLAKVDNKTKITRARAVLAINKNIEKLEAANRPNQAQAIQALTRVRERLQQPVSLKDKLEKNRKLIGGSCGTVSPDSRDECCERKGFDKWDENNNKCITSRPIKLAKRNT